MQLTEFLWAVQSYPRDVGQAQDEFMAMLSGTTLDDQLRDRLAQLKIEPADPKDPKDYMLAVNRHDVDHFRLELKRELIGYQHEADKPEDMTEHIEQFAAPLIGAAFRFEPAPDPRSTSGRQEPDHRIDLTRGLKRCIYRFATRIDCGSEGLKNRRGMVEHLVTGMADEGRAALRLPGDLERVDLKVCLLQRGLWVESGRGTDMDLWLDLQTPGNDDYRYLVAAFVLQTPENRRAHPADAQRFSQAYALVSELAQPLLAALGGGAERDG